MTLDNYDIAGIITMSILALMFFLFCLSKIKGTKKIQLSKLVSTVNTAIKLGLVGWVIHIGDVLFRSLLQPKTLI